MTIFFVEKINTNRNWCSRKELTKKNQELKQQYRFLGILTEIQPKVFLTKVLCKQEVDDNLSVCVLALKVA